MSLTCRCSSAVESGRRCRRALSVCQGNGIYCDGCAHGNDLTPVNEFLKCLLKQIMIFKYQLSTSWRSLKRKNGQESHVTNTIQNVKSELSFDCKSKHSYFRSTCLTKIISPSLSELAEGMLSSKSGMLRSVALSSLCTTIFSLPFDRSISFFASIKDRFSVTVPLIYIEMR